MCSLTLECVLSRQVKVWQWQVKVCKSSERTHGKSSERTHGKSSERTHSRVRCGSGKLRCAHAQHAQPRARHHKSTVVRLSCMRSGIRVLGLGFWVLGLGFWVLGLGFWF